ncbi:sulfite exporter TauE/SafE family protein [Cribrihabitans sp. XS_ASV171]
MSDPATLAALGGTSLLAGAVNAIAGGGTFFTFPVLIWAGLPPLLANTTNMVALLPANLTALAALRGDLRRAGGYARLFAVMGAIGGAGGAVLLLNLGNAVFSALVPWLIGFATLLFAVAPQLRRLATRARPAAEARLGPAPLSFLALVSLYGGYFGAGLGQMTLATLTLCGFTDLRAAIALKNLLIFCITFAAVLVIAAGGTLHWPYAALMFAGSALGGFLGGHLLTHVPAQPVRWAIIAYGTFLTLVYSGVYSGGV